MSPKTVTDVPLASATSHDAAVSPGALSEQRGGLNRETVVKLLIAWTVTPIFAGAVAALAYFVISRF
jgi:phosphate/sulfate permease